MHKCTNNIATGVVFYALCNLKILSIILMLPSAKYSFMSKSCQKQSFCKHAPYPCSVQLTAWWEIMVLDVLIICCLGQPLMLLIRFKYPFSDKRFKHSFHLLIMSRMLCLIVIVITKHHLVCKTALKPLFLELLSAFIPLASSMIM